MRFSFPPRPSQVFGLPPRPWTWRQAWPGIVIVGLVMVARLGGLFQGLEWAVLDTLLRWRPPEPTDERLLIIGINEEDIQWLGTYPVPDQVLADLLQRLNQHDPQAIGIDIFRNLMVEPGHQTLTATWATMPQVIGIERLLIQPPVEPPPTLPPEQVGFVDFPLDEDGFVRRLLLGIHGSDGDFRLSLALRLAMLYLEDRGYWLTNGVRDEVAMRFGETELPRLRPQAGGYRRHDISDLELLINVRSGARPFRQVTLRQALAGEVDPDWIRDAVVLVGITAPSVKDFINSGAIHSANPGLVYGVEMQAHATSQLIHAVMDGRSLLRPWHPGLDYLWILLWGGGAIVLVRWLPSPAWYVPGVGVAGLMLVGISYGSLVGWGWWIPLVPALVGLTFNGLVLPGFYLYDQALRSRLEAQKQLGEARQRVIEQTYNAIHNGPLQNLALLLRETDSHQPWQTVYPQLQALNQDLRGIYEGLLAAPATPTDSAPPPDELLHERLYEIYVETLQRDFPGFKTIGPHLVNVQPLDTQHLSAADQQDIGDFFQEALINVGKYALGSTRLTINCQTTATDNLIQVIDNSPASELRPASPSGGRGTRQAQRLAQRLGGTFQRRPADPGTHCELRWPRSSTH